MLTSKPCASTSVSTVGSWSECPWGCIPGLAYAQRHPQRVDALVLMAVQMTTAAEVPRLTETIVQVFPEQWQAFHDAANPHSGERLVDTYVRLLTDSDGRVRVEAARNWMAWEDVHISLVPATSRAQAKTSRGSLASPPWRRTTGARPGSLATENSCRAWIASHTFRAS